MSVKFGGSWEYVFVEIILLFWCVKYEYNWSMLIKYEVWLLINYSDVMVIVKI